MREKSNIGTPINGTRYYILNSDMNEVEHGEIGELCISGDGLASGYLHQPSVTEDKFIQVRIVPYIYLDNSGMVNGFIRREMLWLIPMEFMNILEELIDKWKFMENDLN